jgi:hypothetical protein
MARSHTNWKASRFEQRQAVEQPQPVGLYPNRDLALAAVPDPYQLETRKPVRVTVALDVLDRLLMARRIGPGEYAAGRCYQRLLEISLGGPALEGGGVRSSQADDLVVRSIVRAERVNSELVCIRKLIGQRSERLLRAILVEANPNTGQAWTVGELALIDALVRNRRTSKYLIFALSQRLVDDLHALAAFWRGTRLET